MKRCNGDDLVKRAASMLGVSEQAIRCGLKVDKWNFGVSFPMRGNQENVFIDEYSLKLVEEGKISPFKGGWTLPNSEDYKKIKWIYSVKLSNIRGLIY